MRALGKCVAIGIVLIFLPFIGLYAELARAEEQVVKIAQIMGPGFVILPEADFLRNGAKLRLKSFAALPSVYEVHSLNSLGDMLRVDSVTVTAKAGEQTLDILGGVSTLVVVPLNAEPWQGTLSFNQQVSPLSFQSKERVPRDMSRILSLELAEQEEGFVVLGNADGIKWICRVATEKHSDPEVPGETSTLPSCGHLGLQGKNFELRMRADISETPVMLYGLVLQEHVIVRIQESILVPSTVEDKPAAVPSCEKSRAAERATLLQAAEARRRAEAAAKFFQDGSAALRGSLLEGAEGKFKQALLEDPASICARINYLSVLRAQGKLESADRQLEILKRLAPEHFLVLSHLGTRFLEKGEFVQAETVLRKGLEMAPHDCSMRANLASAYTSQGQSADRIVELLKGHTAGCASALVVLAGAKRELGDWHAATVLLREALKVSKEQVTATQSNIQSDMLTVSVNGSLADNYLLQSFIHLRLGELDLASMRNQDALKLRPKDLNANAIAADIAMESKQFDQALHHLNQNLAIGGESAALRSARGWVWQSLKQFEAALEDYALALTLNPNLGQVYLNRGLIYLEREQLSEAEADFLRAAELLPDSPDPQSSLQIIERKRRKSVQNPSTQSAKVISIESFDDAAHVAAQYHESIPPEFDDYLEAHQSELLALLESPEVEDQRRALFLISASSGQLKSFSPKIYQFISSADTESSMGAIAAVLKLRDKQAVATLSEVASGDASGCRSCAILALSELGAGTPAVELLVYGLLEEAKPELLSASGKLAAAVACSNAGFLAQLEKKIGDSPNERIQAILRQAKTGALGDSCVLGLEP